MSINLDRLQAPSPRESMHSELIMERNIHELKLLADPDMLEFAAWMKIKNSQDLPVMLLLEYKDTKSERWAMIDTARVRSRNSTILLSGKADVASRKLQEVKLYLCHPSDNIEVQIEELRFNGSLVRKDYIEATSVA
ncbi:MAG: hypothetical protein HKP09_07410 [Enterobacterales bacterium]|nr:hypothetical protein [Enterobacterales bacterium]